MSLRSLVLFALIVGASMPAAAQFWESTDGPPASVTCLITDAQGYVYAGTPFSAVYRTTDLGSTWERKDKGIDDGISDFKAINQLALGKDDVLFAAVNGLGILRSTDHGDNWAKLDIGITISPTARLSVSTKLLPFSTQVFVGYDAGASSLFLRFSEDGGDSFIEIPKSNLPGAMSSIFETFLSPNSDKMFILVSYNKGLYRSSNRGTSWTRIDSDPQSGESNDNFLTMRAAPNGHLYIGRNALAGSAKSENAVVLRSTDDGEKWEYKLDGWDNRDVTNNKVTGIAFGKNNEVWAITQLSSGVFYSSNGGDNWISRNEGLPGGGSGSGVTVTKDGHIFAAPTGEAVHRHLSTSSVGESIPSVVRTASVSPNPARDVVHVRFTLASDAVVMVELFSSDGASVAAPYHQLLTAGEHQLMFPTSDLASGVYAWTVRSGGAAQSGVLSIVR